jgi:folate-binding protein YgfZ
VDFDGGNFPNEAGWEAALSYQKGCYIGQEVIARMRTYGHANRKLMLLLFPDAREVERGTRLYREGREAGEVTSAAVSRRSGRTVALAYLRRGSWDADLHLSVGSPEAPPEARSAVRPAAAPRGPAPPP